MTIRTRWSSDKMAAPHFSMLWNDHAGRATAVTVIAGRYGDAVPPAPPPRSWASRTEGDVAIWTVRMAPEAKWTLPPAQPGTNRTLFLFRGSAARVGGRAVPVRSGVKLVPELEVEVVNGAEPAELLLLQGRPIGEPVAQYGPFVMNTRAEIQQAFADYQATRFGGWPWPNDAPVHERTRGRFARHADGKVEHAG